MRNHTIAIQGSASFFHDLATQKYFGEEATVVECDTFKSVCDKISNNEVDYGIIPMENKVVGSILLNYRLIEQYNLSIIGEVHLPIELQLLAKPNVEIQDILEIVSHPMALEQSQTFLSELSAIRVTEYKDSTTSAKAASKAKSNNIAVIAGPVVAKKFGLRVLIDNVCDVKNNYTRFYLLAKENSLVNNPDKASVMIQTDRDMGRLSDILRLIRRNGLDLTKIQSIPVPEEENAYAFHMDIEFEDMDLFEDSIRELRFSTKSIKVLGKYKKENKGIQPTKKNKLKTFELAANE